MRVCFVVTPVRYEVGQFFFSSLFLYFFQKSKHLFKKNRAVEAAKGNRLSLRCIKIHLGRIRSKRCRLENWDFLHTLFLENEVQINRNNYATMLFMSKQLSLPKISSILQKIKIGPKCHICPFCTKPFNCAIVLSKKLLSNGYLRDKLFCHFYRIITTRFQIS